MSSRVWFYYANGKQVGPMPETELRDAIKAKIISLEDHVYREGFADWKQLKAVSELKEMQETASLTPVSKEERRNAASPRAGITELVVAHNDRHMAQGRLKNISISGLFLETADKNFQVNDEIKLTLKEGKGLGKPLNLRGVIVRQQREGGTVQGYGLELRGLDERVITTIEDYVKRNKQAS